MPGAAEEAVAGADVILVVGTSAVVYPAAGLIHRPRGSRCAVIEINLDPTPASGSATIGLYGPAGSIVPDLVARLHASRD